MTIVISEGARTRYVHKGADRQFAHIFDPDSASGADGEDVAHQAWNFVTYATALGGYDTPIVLISPPVDPDPVEEQHIQIELAGWKSLVETATRCPVEIR